jgi:nucleoside phosphorylase
MLDRYDIGLLVPLKEEFEQVQSVLPVHDSDGAYHELKVPDGAPTVVSRFIAAEMGPPPALIHLGQLVHRYSPKLLAVVGIAGSLSKDFRIGDVLVASEIHEYDTAGKVRDRKGAKGNEEGDGEEFELQWGGAAPIPLPQRLKELIANASVNNSTANAWRDWQNAAEHRMKMVWAAVQHSDKLGKLVRQCPKAELGKLASGPYVVTGKGFRNKLHNKDRNLDGVEMEGLAAARWAEVLPGTSWVVIRGISDRYDEDKTLVDSVEDGDGPGALRRIAARNAAEFFRLFLQLPGVLADPATRMRDAVLPVGPASPRESAAEQVKRMLDRMEQKPTVHPAGSSAHAGKLLDYLLIAEVAVTGLEEERQQILEEALRACDAPAPDWKPIARRLGDFLRTDVLRRPLAKALGGFEGYLHALKNSPDLAPEQESAIAAIERLYSKLSEYFRNLSYEGGSAPDAQTLVLLHAGIDRTEVSVDQVRAAVQKAKGWSQAGAWMELLQEQEAAKGLLATAFSL